MGNKKTPLLQKLRNVGGTLYVFPSAAEDIGLNLQSTTTGVAMSHFALLNIPKLTINDCIKNCTHDITADNGNEALAMSLQNYAMNFETLLTNREDYNYQKPETVSEKVFWHWAMHIGILKPSDISNNLTGNENIYIENAYDSSSATPDATVIKCFGSIDAGNSLSTEFGMFNETYINIPTSWGAGPVYLKHSDSANFKLNTKYPIKDSNHLEGRGDSNEYYSYTGGKDYPCYDSSNNNVFKYEIYDTSDGFEILKDLNQIQTASRNKFNNENLIFSSYDDINIDIENNLHIDQEFKFNTILLYYSIYDQDDLVKTAYATNLFGVIFLDGTKPDGDGFVIPSLTKRKSTTSQFGNSYSFRVNLKTMSVYDNTDAIIQDNTTMSGVSAVEFSDAISNLNRAIDIMNSNLTTTLAIQDQYASIISYYDNFEDDLRDISTCLNAYLKGTRSSFIDTSVLYANEIRTTEGESLFGKNSILIRTHKESKDENGNVIYNEPVVTIEDEYVNIPTLYNNTLWNKQSYIITEKDVSTFLDINAADNRRFASVNICMSTIDDAFSAEEGVGFVVRLKKHVDAYTGEQSFNELYIDPDTSIFRQATNKNLKCLLDASNNINYTAIIPYIINKVQRLNANIEGFTYNAGLQSFAEGRTNSATGRYSHAEGLNTITTNRGEHAEGMYNLSNSSTIHSIGIGTGTETSKRSNAVEVLNDGSIYINGLGGYNGTNPANASTLQDVIRNAGSNVTLQDGENITITKYGNTYSISAIGYDYWPDEMNTFFEGNSAKLINGAKPHNTHTEGLANIIDADTDKSHVEGITNYINAKYCHIQGVDNQINEKSDFSFAGGNLSIVNKFSPFSFAYGRKVETNSANTFIGGTGSQILKQSATSFAYGQGVKVNTNSPYSFAAGLESQVLKNSSISFVYGEGVQADYKNMFVIGKYNKITDNEYITHKITDDPSGSSWQEILSVGCGIDDTKRQTIFNVVGKWENETGKTIGEMHTNEVYCDHVNNPGFDYAEYLEWADGNPNNKERIGLFVTLDDNGKIRIATSGDDIIGVVSATPGIIGNAAEEEWSGKYLRDVYGRKIMAKDEDDSSNIKYHEVLNPDYDPNIEYIPRSKRKEWAVVGFMGQFIINDNGTCVPGKRCTCGENGVATHTTSKNGYRVLKRLDDTHIKIIASFL